LTPLPVRKRTLPGLCFRHAGSLEAFGVAGYQIPLCTFVISFPAVILLRLLMGSLQARDRHLETRGWDKPLVHIVDREADSVAHWRTWSAQGSRFLVRAKDAPKVCFEGVPVKPKELAERLSYQSAGEGPGRGVSSIAAALRCRRGSRSVAGA